METSITVFRLSLVAEKKITIVPALSSNHSNIRSQKVNTLSNQKRKMSRNRDHRHLPLKSANSETKKMATSSKFHKTFLHQPPIQQKHVFLKTSTLKKPKILGLSPRNDLHQLKPHLSVKLLHKNPHSKAQKPHRSQEITFKKPLFQRKRSKYAIKALPTLKIARLH